MTDTKHYLKNDGQYNHKSYKYIFTFSLLTMLLRVYSKRITQLKFPERWNITLYNIHTFSFMLMIVKLFY